MKNRIKFKLPIMLLACVPFVQMTSAAILVGYDFGTTGASTYSATTTEPGVTGSDIANGNLFVFTTADLTYTSGSVLQTAPQNGSSTAALAVGTDSYFEFTVTPDALVTMDLASLTFNAAAGGSSGGDRGYEVRSSVDSYAASLGSAVLATVRPNWTGVTIDLSAAAFDELTTVTTFRIYTFTDSRGRSVEYDDIQLVGTIPEPATLGLVAAFGGGLLFVRRLIQM